MSIFLRSAGLAALGLFAISAFAGDIGPGSAAPPLEIKAWYKGSPIKSLDPSKTYVVEFWATWCGPCKQSIPHLTELAHKNKDVTFIGVSIWEDDKDDNIKNFVAEMGDKMDYNVAYSSNKDGMAKSWMAAAAQNGIPSAFIVKGGKIQWVGHPMTMEEPLAQIKAGTFDSTAFKDKFEKSAAVNREQMTINTELNACIKLYDSGKTEEAKKNLDTLVSQHANAKIPAEMTRFNWTAKEDPKKWEEMATKMAKSKDQDQIMTLCSFAYRAVSDPKQNADLGRKAIELAIDATEGKDFMVEQYASVCYTATRDYKLALDAVNKCLELFPTTPYKDNVDAKTSLEKQKADLEAKLKGQ